MENGGLTQDYQFLILQWGGGGGGGDQILPVLFSVKSLCSPTLLANYTHKILLQFCDGSLVGGRQQTLVEEKRKGLQ